MPSSRPGLYAAALAGLLLFGALVLLDILMPGALPSGLSLAVSLGLAICGIAVLVLRPRGRRRGKLNDQPQDFTTLLEERRRMAEEAARRGPRLPVDREGER